MTFSFTNMCNSFTLLVGGAASGKSDIAEKICCDSGLDKFYLATAQVFDNEMRTKIAHHRTARGESWCTIEEPFAAARIISERRTGEILLMDCATLWLTNHLLAEHDIAAQTRDLLSAIAATPAQIVIVTNEVGQGIVPENALARRFRNAQGRLNRDLAAQAETVVGVMAGLPFALKGPLPEALR